MRSNCNLNRLMKKRELGTGMYKNRKVLATSASETIAGSVFNGMGIAKSKLRKSIAYAKNVTKQLAYMSRRKELIDGFEKYNSRTPTKNEIRHLVTLIK